MVKKLSRYLLTAITALLCSLAIILATPWGSHLSVIVANQFNVLSLSYKSGAWLDGITFDRIKVDTENEAGKVTIEATEVTINLHLRCLINNTLCVDKIVGDEFLLTYINYTSDSSPKAQENKPTPADEMNNKQLIRLPYSFDISALHFNHVNVTVNRKKEAQPSSHKSTIQAETENTAISAAKNLTDKVDKIVAVDVYNVSAAAYLKQSLIKVGNPQANKALVTLLTRSNNENENKEEKSEPWQQLAQLPSIDLPLDLQINKLELNELAIKQQSTNSSDKVDEKSTPGVAIKPSENTLNFQQISLTGAWLENDVTINQSEFSFLGFDNLNSTSNIDSSDSSSITDNTDNGKANTFATQGTVKLTTPYQLNLTQKITLEQFPLWPEIESSQHQLIVNGKLNQLTATLLSEGSIDANAEVSLDLLSANFPFNIELSINKLPLIQQLNKQLSKQLNKPEIAEALIIHQAKLTAEGDFQDHHFNSDLKLSGFEYHDAELAFAGNVQDGLISLEQLSFNDSASNSQLAAKGTFSLNETLSWQGEITSTGFTLPPLLSDLSQLGFEPLSGRLAGTVISQGQFDLSDEYLADEYLAGENSSDEQQNKSPSPPTDKKAISAWQIEITQAVIQGQLNQLPFALNAHGKIDHHLNITPCVLSLTALNNQLDLTGYRDENWQIEGQLISHDLSLVNALVEKYYQAQNTNNQNSSNLNSNNLGTKETVKENNNAFVQNLHVTGKQVSQLSITGEKTQPLIHFSSTSDKLSFEQFSLQSPKLNIQYQPLNEHLITLKFTSDKVYVQQHQFEQVDAALTGNIFNQESTVSWQGDLAATLALTSQFQPQQQLISSQLTLAEFTYQKEKVSLVDAINSELNLKNMQLSVAEHCWQHQYLSLCAENELAIGKIGDIALTAKINGDWLNQRLLPQNVTVSTAPINGKLHASWQENTAPKLKGNFDISAGNISYIKPSQGEDDDITVEQKTMLSQWQHGNVEFSLIDKKLHSNFSLIKQDEQPLVKVNQQLSLANNALSGRIIFNEFSLKPLQNLVPEISHVDAKLSSNLSISGTLEKPSINGNAYVNQGEIDFNRSSNHIDNFNLLATINNQTATITGDLNVDKAPANYAIDINWQEAFYAKARMNAEKIALDFPPNISVEVAPSLSAFYQDDLLRIEGGINIIDGTLAIAEFPEGSVKVSDDTIIVDDYGKTVSEKNKLTIESDINITINERFKLEGFGFNGNLSGDLNLQKNKQHPMQLYGNMSVLNGFYQAYGQNLGVKRGKITFNGPIKNPQVDFRAERYIKKDDVEVGINVNGLSNAIELQLYSQPAMEQPEILSYLIRGQGLDSGTGNTAAIGFALGTTLTKAENLNKLIQKLPLLHDISVDTEVDGDQAQATISGYLGDRIYLKYGVGIYDPIDEITVRFFLMNKLWLETVSGIEKSADIYYSFDVE